MNKEFKIGQLVEVKEDIGPRMSLKVVGEISKISKDGYYITSRGKEAGPFEKRLVKERN